MKDYTQIKTLKDACEATGNDFNVVSGDNIGEQLKVIVKALNGDWIAQYANHNQLKFIPSLPNDADIPLYAFTSMDVVFKSYEIAQHFITHFVLTKIKSIDKDKGMIVKDLIEHLKQFDPNKKVHIADCMKGESVQLNINDIRQSTIRGEDVIEIW